MYYFFKKPVTSDHVLYDPISVFTLETESTLVVPEMLREKGWKVRSDD